MSLCNEIDHNQDDCRRFERRTGPHKLKLAASLMAAYSGLRHWKTSLFSVPTANFCCGFVGSRGADPPESAISTALEFEAGRRAHASDLFTQSFMQRLGRSIKSNKNRMLKNLAQRLHVQRASLGGKALET